MRITMKVQVGTSYLRTLTKYEATEHLNKLLQETFDIYRRHHPLAQLSEEGSINEIDYAHRFDEFGNEVGLDISTKEFVFLGNVSRSLRPLARHHYEVKFHGRHKSSRKPFKE